MNTRRSSLIILLILPLALFTTTFAWTASASITVIFNKGAISLNSSSTFSSYTYCDNATPPRCTTYNSGTLYVYQNSTLTGSATGNGSASWITAPDDGAFFQINRGFKATVVEYDKVPHSSSMMIMINNRPLLTLVIPIPVKLILIMMEMSIDWI